MYLAFCPENIAFIVRPSKLGWHLEKMQAGIRHDQWWDHPSPFFTSSSDTTAGEIRVPICEPATPRTAFEMRVAGSRMHARHSEILCRPGNVSLQHPSNQLRAKRASANLFVSARTAQFYGTGTCLLDRRGRRVVANYRHGNLLGGDAIPAALRESFIWKFPCLERLKNEHITCCNNCA